MYIFLNGVIVSWRSFKQDTVADSTIESEYMAVSDATKEVVWLKKFITGFYVISRIVNPVDLYYDNNRGIARIKEPKSHQRTK